MNTRLGSLFLSSAMLPAIAGCATNGTTTHTGAITQVEISERRYVAMTEREIAAAHAKCAEKGLSGDNMSAARLIAQGTISPFNVAEACAKAGYAASR